ncbi:flagellar hook-length control protein FliK [Erwinia typographi]|uniref:flagellar hook-length control protein FliK n=1 Tax=Erwinia typographi TaxID=371042 RepID=UPI0006908BCD|nr:flagellar hook-length control protein FliK [Erwinia typographi]
MIIQAKPVVALTQTNKTLSTETPSERFVDTLDRTLTSRDKKADAVDKASSADEHQPVADNDLHHDAADKVAAGAIAPVLIGLNPPPAERGGVILPEEGLRPQMQQLLAQVSAQQAPETVPALPEKGETALTGGKAQMLPQAGRRIAAEVVAAAQQRLPEAENADDSMLPGAVGRGKANLREPLWNPVSKSSARDVAPQPNAVATNAAAVAASKPAGEPDKGLVSGLPQEPAMIKADSNAAPLAVKAPPVSGIAEMAEDNASQPISAHHAVTPGKALPLSAGALNQPVNTPAWQQEMSQQLAIFYRHGVQNAELRLHPEELGALQISMRVVNNQAQMHFVTENHQVRAALEAAMPHLRTSLAESGIDLGQSSVGDEGASSWQSSRQSGRGGSERQNDSEGEDVGLALSDAELAPGRQSRGANGINTFA